MSHFERPISFLRLIPRLLLQGLCAVVYVPVGLVPRIKDILETVKEEGTSSVSLSSSGRLVVPTSKLKGLTYEENGRGAKKGGSKGTRPRMDIHVISTTKKGVTLKAVRVSISFAKKKKSSSYSKCQMLKVVPQDVPIFAAEVKPNGLVTETKTSVPLTPFTGITM